MHINQKADRHKLLQMSEISLMLDNYDDLFSDFDPRPYSQRALSQDFLAESQRASRDLVTGKIELKFLISSAKRNAVQENIIKKRLKEHFKKHFNLIHNDIKKMINQGISITSLGILLMFIATLILFKYAQTNILTSFLIILLEPAGWFTFWHGLDKILFESKKLKPGLEFYRKMSKSEITFLSY